MVSVDEAARLAMDLPGVTADTRRDRTWVVGDSWFAKLRLFSKADLRRFGDEPVPKGPIFAVRVANLRAKEAVLAAGTRGVFTIPHFDNFAAVLIQLDVVPKRALQQLITDAWLACVPPSLSEQLRVRSRRRR